MSVTRWMSARAHMQREIERQRGIGGGGNSLLPVMESTLRFFIAGTVSKSRPKSASPS